MNVPLFVNGTRTIQILFRGTFTRKQAPLNARSMKWNFAL